MFDTDTAAASPADILQRRVNTVMTPATRADSPADALSVSLGEGRGVDLERIAGLLQIPVSDCPRVLGDLVFELPHRPGQWETARDYLSGDIRTKLGAAQTAASADPSRWGRNAAALEKALPAQLTDLEIEVRLGAPWVTANDVEDFARDVLGVSGSVTHVPEVASWEV